MFAFSLFSSGIWRTYGEEYDYLSVIITCPHFLHCLAAFCEDTDCVGFARLGSEDQMIIAGSMRQLREVDFGAPLHCLVIVGKTHPVEEEMLDFYELKGESAESLNTTDRMK